MDKSTKRRRTASEWEHLVSQWHASGLSADEFSEQHELNAGTMRWWQTRLKKKRTKRSAGKARSATESGPSTGQSFTEVVVTGAVERPFGMEVVSRSGHVIRLQGSVDREALVKVLEAVERC